ncbi:MAG: hypothetical protein ACW98Y_15950 [Candidatus Thorarchaeota archaeon]|jgi:hypothetical protein
MMYLFEIPVDIAIALVLAIPIVTIIFALSLILLRNRVNSPRIKWFIEKMTTPLSLKVDDNGTANESSSEYPNRIVWSKVVSLLVFLYIGLFLFVIGNMLGVFYTVMGDVLEAISQGSTGDAREVFGIAFLDPYNAGWLGSLPWYGNYPLPLSNEVVYHDPWEWIYFTGLLWNNPDFFNYILNEVILFTFGMSLFFLLPLLIPHIRRSFLPSLFLFTSGMYVASTAILRCFAQVIELGYLGDSLLYGSYEQSIVGVDPTAVPSIVAALGPYVVVLAIIFPLLGYKLWRGFYPENRKSAVWFAIYILGSFFLTFLIALW